MIIEALHHENHGTFACPVSADTLSLRLRTARDEICECYVYYTEKYDYTPNLLFKRMDYFAYDNYFDYFCVEITLKSKRFKYFFKLVDIKGEVLYYLEDRFDKSFPENSLAGGFFQYPYINSDELMEIPGWARNAVLYQIFPDRFCNGGRPNDRKKLQKWGTKPKRNSFYGGDLKGITKKLDYLEELGVNAIYINPVFLSDSNHKYDTIDYYTIDPTLGSLDDAVELVEEAHKKGMRVILDAVFNHCSHKNKIFQDIVRRGEKSPYKDWFFFEGFPVRIKPITNYETFGINIHNMPRINTSNPAAREYLLGVAEYWTKALDIDGWRLDVADEVSHGFWKEFKKRLRAVKKDIFIIGEVWYYSTVWLMGDEFDSVMNYPIRKAVMDFFLDNRINADEFIAELNKGFLAYRDEIPYTLLNLLGSHDTDRIMTLCKGDVRILKLAVTFIMTFIGIPLIYYGDELGMKGGGDPECRGTMIWDRSEFNNEILEFYKKMISFRNRYPILVNGKFKPLRITQDENVLAYLRYDCTDTAVVILNNSDKKIQVKLSENMLVPNKKEFHEQIGGEEYCAGKAGMLSITLDRKTAALLI